MKEQGPQGGPTSNREKSENRKQYGLPRIEDLLVFGLENLAVIVEAL